MRTLGRSLGTGVSTRLGAGDIDGTLGESVNISISMDGPSPGSNGSSSEFRVSSDEAKTIWVFASSLIAASTRFADVFTDALELFRVYLKRSMHKTRARTPIAMYNKSLDALITLKRTIGSPPAAFQLSLCISKINKNIARRVSIAL